MARYEQYKDSGFDEIGRIPDHWTIVPLKAIFRFGRGLSITKANLQDEGVPVISYGQIHSKENSGYCLNEDLFRFVSPEYLNSGQQSLVKENDFLFADTSEDFEGCGNCVFVDRLVDNLFAGYHTVVVRPTRFDNHFKYISFLFLSQAWRTCLRKKVNGVKVFSVTQSILKQQPILLPPIEEQKSIADYLASETGKIDEAIQQQQKTIDLLNERRQIIISDAVTKGINPDVQMKDSGIDLLGEIPGHWLVRKFKRVAEVKANLVPPNRFPDLPQIAPENIEKGSGKVINFSTVSESGVISDNHYFHAGQIIYSKIRPTLNKVIIAPFDGLCSADMYPITTSLNVRYLLYYMLSSRFVRQVHKVVMDRVKMPKINKEELSQIYVIVPPQSEQEAISVYLDNKLSSIDRAIERCLAVAKKLAERKRIIINDFVTGKVKVL